LCGNRGYKEKVDKWQNINLLEFLPENTQDCIVGIMEAKIFRDVRPSRRANVYKYFEELYFLHIYGLTIHVERPMLHALL